MPAMRASRVSPAEALNHARSDISSHRVLRVRGGLVVIQVALSLTLVVAAALLIRSFAQLGAVPLGFDSRGMLVVDVNASRSTVDGHNRAAFFERLADAARAVPGVARDAASLNTPLNHGVTLVGDFRVPSGADVPRGERRTIINLVTPGWFDTCGIRVLAGRTIGRQDGPGAPKVMVVNDAFARKFLPGRNAVGAGVTTDFPVKDAPVVTYTIVGVVADVVDQSLRAGPYPMVFMPPAQFSTPILMPATALSVRAAAGSPLLLSRSIGAALKSVDPNLSFTFHDLSDQVDAARQQERLVAWLSGFFGVLAMALAAIGLYGITAYAVTRRRADIGIRMALGALRRDVVSVALRQTAFVIAVGVAAGLVVAAGTMRYLQALLFGVTPLDPAMFGVAATILVVVGLLACYVPVRRAASVNPMDALRCE
jgi:predicted permease